MICVQNYSLLTTQRSPRGAMLRVGFGFYILCGVLCIFKAMVFESMFVTNQNNTLTFRGKLYKHIAPPMLIKSCRCNYYPPLNSPATCSARVADHPKHTLLYVCLHRKTGSIIYIYTYIYTFAIYHTYQTCE